MKKVIPVLLAVLFSDFSYAQKVYTVKYESRFKIKTMYAGSTKYFKLICYVPNDIENVQKVKEMTFSDEPDTVFVEGDNKFAVFTLEDLAPEHEIIIGITMDIFLNDLTTRLKSGVFIREDSLAPFLIDEKYIETNDEHIRAAASKLRGKETLKTVKYTYDFVNKHLTYEKSAEENGALAALKSGKGDCSEFSDLFVALCRANNIPARTISGYTLDYLDFGKHSWAEVYLDQCGWVRFEPIRRNNATFKKTINAYIQLVSGKNNSILKNYLYYCEYLGKPVEVINYYVLKL